MLCSNCSGPIDEDFLLKIGNEFWHERCLKCSLCGIFLNDKCYEKFGSLFCAKDYFRWPFVWIWIAKNCFEIWVVVCFVNSQLTMWMVFIGMTWNRFFYWCNTYGLPVVQGVIFMLQYAIIIFAYLLKGPKISQHYL